MGRPPRRVTSQHSQEKKSRRQFEECLDDHGWLCEPFSEDIGEDHLVRIYTRGRSSGLSFFVQLKSTRDATGLPTVDNTVSYRIPVKDLLHWEDNIPAVFLVLWDLKGHAGFWVSVREAVKRLDSFRLTWRSRGSRAKIAVHFPTKQRLDAAGLAAIRHRVAMDALPIVSKGKDFTIAVRMAFPPTEEGRAKMSEWERHVATGAPAEIPQDFIESVQFPEFWNRLFDEAPRPASISMGPTSSGRTVPIAMRARAASGASAHIPYIESVVVQEGEGQITLSNRGRKAAAYVSMVIHKKEGRCEVTVRPGWGAGLAVEDHIRAARLFQCMSEGCELELTMLKPEDGAFTSAVVAPQPALTPPKDWLELLEDLATIQRSCNVTFQLPEEGVSRVDAASAHRIAAIVARGYLPLDASKGSYSLKREIVEGWTTGAQFPFHYEFARPWMQEEEKLQLLGTAIDLGPSEVRARGVFERQDLLNRLASSGPAEQMTLSLADAEVRRVWARFLPAPESESLSGAGPVPGRSEGEPQA